MWVDRDGKPLDLRCERCGALRQSYGSEHMPGKLFVTCNSCWEERLRKLPLVIFPEPPLPRRSGLAFLDAYYESRFVHGA